MWNFKGYLWNSTQNIWPIHWKIWFLYNIKLWRHFRAHTCFWNALPQFSVEAHGICILHSCFTGTGAIAWLPQRQWSNWEGYGEITLYLTITKQSTNHVDNPWDILRDSYCISHIVHQASISWEAGTNQQLSTRLLYLQCINDRDTAVSHWAIEIILSGHWKR